MNPLIKIPGFSEQLTKDQIKILIRKQNVFIVEDNYRLHIFEPIREITQKPFLLSVPQLYFTSL
mgnify:FL=1